MTALFLPTVRADYASIVSGFGSLGYWRFNETNVSPPASQFYDLNTGLAAPIHSYQLERSPTLDPPAFAPAGPPTTDLHITIPDCCNGTVFYRVQLLAP